MAGGAGGGAPGTPVVIANWNVQNFFNALNDSAAPQETIVSGAEYAAKRQAVGKVLVDLGADIVVLQEVENLAVLDDLDATELAGAYPHRVLVDGNDLRGIDVGILSKIPIDLVVSHKDDQFALAPGLPPYKFTRDCIEAHLTVNGRELVLLGVHFRSKGSNNVPDDPDKRLAEAVRTREIADALLAEDPTRAVVVLGDFNDTPGSPPVEAVRGSGASAFFDATDLVAEADRWTFDYMGQKQLIDHQMSSPIGADLLVTGTILGGTLVDDASDHRVVVGAYSVK